MCTHNIGMSFKANWYGLSIVTSVSNHQTTESALTKDCSSNSQSLELQFSAKQGTSNCTLTYTQVHHIVLNETGLL